MHFLIRAIVLFLIIASTHQTAFCQAANRVDVGKSFANLSKLSSGGTFNPGDTVEIRVTIAVLTQGSYTAIDSVQVFDNVPAKTIYIPGSMRIATNEGLTYRGPFTEAADADPGRNVAGAITINLGNTANGVKGGRIRSDTSRPSFYGAHCIMMACYKVRIDPSAVYGDTIRITGRVRYKMATPANGFINVFFPQYNLLLFPNSGYCSNGSDVSGASDFSGTFGGGTTPDRAASLAFSTTYLKQNIGTGQPNDYGYAIVKNSSPDSWTNVNAPMPEGSPTHRVFGFWDIGGDHTNAVNTASGNVPPAATDSSGYFVLVNSSYNTNVAYQETLNSLCPNTYYEFSAWFRNVCPRCGCDSIGRGSGWGGFLPGPGNDSAGVKPNLNFEIDGLAYFTTGDIRYDRGVPWKKFGFVFRTRAGQNFANFVIRNNSPGGGGNDWAIDDIKISHCGPSSLMNYSPEALGCRESPFPVFIRDTIRHIYNNYVYFKWQKSNVGGTVWADMTGPGTSGIGSPVLVNGLYEYVAALPAFLATAADSGTYYRVVVATSPANLASARCAYKDDNTTMIRAITCGVILDADFINFSGSVADKKALLTWDATNEQGLAKYEIESSSDGVNFKRIGFEYAKNLPLAGYRFKDPEDLKGTRFYRLKMISNNNSIKYSSVIKLSAAARFEVNHVVNPFTNMIAANITVPDAGNIRIRLYDGKGKMVRDFAGYVNKGLNKVEVSQTANLSAGIYFIAVEYRNEVFRTKLVRL